MGRVEEGYRDLLLETMKDWKDTVNVEGSSLQNSLDAQNNFINLVNTLETFMWPKLIQYKYDPQPDKDWFKEGHNKMREMMRVAADADLITPYEIVDEWNLAGVDMESPEQVE